MGWLGCALLGERIGASIGCCWRWWWRRPAGSWLRLAGAAGGARLSGSSRGFVALSWPTCAARAPVIGRRALRVDSPGGCVCALRANTRHEPPLCPAATSSCYCKSITSLHRSARRWSSLSRWHQSTIYLQQRTVRARARCEKKRKRARGRERERTRPHC